MFPALSAARQKTDNQIYFFVQPLQHFSYSKTFSTKLFLIFRISSFSWRETFFLFSFRVFRLHWSIDEGFPCNRTRQCSHQTKAEQLAIYFCGCLISCPFLRGDARCAAMSAISSWSRQMTSPASKWQLEPANDGFHRYLFDPRGGWLVAQFFWEVLCWQYRCRLLQLN